MRHAITYDADGQRVTRTANGITTVYIGGLSARDAQSGGTRYNMFNGHVVAQCSSIDTNRLISLHGGHCSSIAHRHCAECKAPHALSRRTGCVPRVYRRECGGENEWGRYGRRDGDARGVAD